MALGKAADVTGLLKAWRGGDEAALDRLTTLVHAELHRIARRYMRNERPGNTLQATALVNEVYLRLVDVKTDPMTSRELLNELLKAELRQLRIRNLAAEERLIADAHSNEEAAVAQKGIERQR